MKFETWIRKQKDRDDPIGDLANDFIGSSKTYYSINKKHLKLTIDHLYSSGACKGAIDAFRVAQKEYNKIYGRQLLSIKASEIDTSSIDKTPGKFFGYIDKKGYVTLKIYSTKQRYKEIRDDDMPLFIPVFVANGYDDAMIKLKSILDNAINFKGNNWDFYKKRST